MQRATFGCSELDPTPPDLDPYDDLMASNNPRESKAAQAIGAGVAIGAGAGAALFAATGNPVWIGVFAGMGVAIGGAIAARSEESDDT